MRAAFDAAATSGYGATASWRSGSILPELEAIRTRTEQRSRVCLGSPAIVVPSAALRWTCCHLQTTLIGSTFRGSGAQACPKREGDRATQIRHQRAVSAQH